MKKTVTISNDVLKVELSTLGAEITSVKKNGQEFIWQADPKFWARQSPVLFPVCGGLKNDKYTFCNREFSMQKHGFAKISEFSIEYIDKEKAVFLLSANEETKKVYPFDFELRVIFSLSGNSLNIEYDVKNLTDGDMYFSIGGHEGYACSGGIEDWRIVFDKEEDLYSYALDGNLITDNKSEICKNTNILPLKYDYFTIDALIFLDLKSRKLSLENDKTSQKITVEFDDFPYLLLWTVKDAPFLCVEPWCGLPDAVGSSGDFSGKKGIIHLAKGGATQRVHRIIFSN